MYRGLFVSPQLWLRVVAGKGIVSTPHDESMNPLKTVVSERRAANLCQQVRWRDGVCCPRCRAESVIRYGSYRVFRRIAVRSVGCPRADVERTAEDKLPVSNLADRGDRYVIPAKAADESTIRLLLANRQQESVAVYTDGFRAYDPLDEDEAFTRKYVVHGDGEYVDVDVHVNACESHASLTRW